MCGIVAHVGSRDCVPILLEGLARLEYRGYDSAGLAVVARSGELRVHKAKGRVADLSGNLPARFKGGPGIGHTRWATHGEPSDINAHPHVAGTVAVVHNGIIENADELRAKLAAEGAEFASETDSEVLAHLIARSSRDDLEEAVREALTSVVGTYGGQLGAQLVRVLDDPVVHHRDRPGHVRVSVDVARLTMRRPPGVANSRATLEPRRQVAAKVSDPALGLVNAQVTGARHNREPGRVVPAVLQPGQPLQQDGHTVPAPHMRNDPAHVPDPLP